MPVRAGPFQTPAASLYLGGRSGDYGDKRLPE